MFYPLLLGRAKNHPAYDGSSVLPTPAEHEALLACVTYARLTISSVEQYFLQEGLHVLGEWYAPVRDRDFGRQSYD